MAINWFTVWKVITPIKKVNSLLRRSVLLPVWNVERLMIKKHSGKT